MRAWEKRYGSSIQCLLVPTLEVLPVFFTSHNALCPLLFWRSAIYLKVTDFTDFIYSFDVPNELTMSNQEHREFLGTWNLVFDKKETKVDVYEFRYLWQLRTGIELVNRQDKNAGVFAVLSSNVPEVPLEPGEFIVKSFSENKDLWPQMKEFPEFEDTGKFALLLSHKCPIWRLRSHDICCQEELKNKAESELHFTGMIERMFASLQENRPKRQYKDVMTAGRLIGVLESFCQSLCESDFFSKDTQRLKHNEKRLVNVRRGTWKIVSETQK